ncbi:MAG TPA: alpha/beta fold hydrolase, partial [Acidimicrobiia bacterium]|nr:alpha/beta fold hydrolase [Acidimicrobiia bacterium]
MAATVVLVHGAWHGAWCWDYVVERLRANHVEALAIDLPGHGTSTEPLGDLSVDAAALRSVLDDLEDAVVCGHSYGGAVISEGAADHPAVRHLVYLAAIVLDVGESCSASVT